MAGRPLRRKRLMSRKRRRDESRDWRGQPRRHKLASRKGWKSHAKPSWTPKRAKKRDASYASPARDARKRKKSSGKGWPGQKKRHAQAAARGWFVTGKRGWIPKHATYSGVLNSTAKPRKKKRSKSRDMTERDHRYGHHKRYHRASRYR